MIGPAQDSRDFTREEKGKKKSNGDSHAISRCQMIDDLHAPRSTNGTPYLGASKQKALPIVRPLNTHVNPQWPAFNWRGTHQSLKVISGIAESK